MTGLHDAASEADFSERLGETPVVIADFYTPDCTICHNMEPMLAAAERTFDGRMRVVKVDAAAHLELAARYDVRGVPTLVLFRDGAMADRKGGFLTASQLRAWVRDNMPGESA